MYLTVFYKVSGCERILKQELDLKQHNDTDDTRKQSFVKDNTKPLYQLNLRQLELL